MKSVYFLKYNNYANRILKIGTQMSDYLGADSENLLQKIENTTLWNPQDGITTEMVTAVPKTENLDDFALAEPDYVIVADEYNNIDSRWFVIECRRLQRGQYNCTLKRDVFAEAWQDLVNADCHIDRAILLNEDPLIFNPEPITVNEILHAEYPIKDATGVPWIVFYAADKPSAITNYDPVKHTFDVQTDNIVTWEAAREFNFLPNDLKSIQIQVPGYTGFKSWKLNLLPNGMSGVTASHVTDPVGTMGVPQITDPSAINNAGAISAFKSQFTLSSATDAAEIVSLDGKVLYDNVNDKYYRIAVTLSAVSQVQQALGIAGSATYLWAQTMLNTCVSYLGANTVLPHQLETFYQYQSTSITLTEIAFVSAVDIKVPTNSVKPSDAPYYMWCMPYGKISMEVTDGTTKTVTADPVLNLSIASEIANKNSSDNTFDVQILPFCPLPDEFIDPDDGSIVVDDTTITDFGTITQHTDSSVVKGFIFACPKCSFTRFIEAEFYPYYPSYKMSDICNKVRMYAPNYSSSFEFSPARNNGINGFNIRCTYMPIQPYIRVAPLWSGLYGNEMFDKDPRGLICSGNYSIARLNDPWVQYQEQNKNFEAIFNREIEHMDVQRKYERAGQIAGALAGTVTGAAAGAAAGTFIPGVGTIAGGIVGGIGSAVTGAADVAHAEKLFQESKSYATDLHYLQLGNVQAMPRSLSKTTAFNVDNRYFPILAYYLPTEKEADLVDQYINIHSMNVDAEGKPIDYIYNRYKRQGDTFTDRGFISGSIIRIETPYDTHFVDELNKEFQKGVYLR